MGDIDLCLTDAEHERIRAGELPNCNGPPWLVALRHNHRMVVKRTRKRTETYALGVLKLYRDDLEQIAKAVAEAGDLVIRCGDWELSSPDDFSDPDLPERLPDLTMTAGRPGSDAHVEVSLGFNVALVTLTEPDTLTRGILHRIQEVCRERHHWFIQYSALIVSIVCGIGAILPFYVWFGPVLHVTSLRIIIALVASCASASIYFLMVQLALTLTIRRVKFLMAGSAILINVYRSDRPGFWHSTRNDWILGTVWALVGGVIGYLVNQIT